MHQLHSFIHSFMCQIPYLGNPMSLRGSWSLEKDLHGNRWLQHSVTWAGKVKYRTHWERRAGPSLLQEMAISWIALNSIVWCSKKSTSPFLVLLFLDHQDSSFYCHLFCVRMSSWTECARNVASTCPLAEWGGCPKGHNPRRHCIWSSGLLENALFISHLWSEHLWRSFLAMQFSWALSYWSSPEAKPGIPRQTSSSSCRTKSHPPGSPACLQWGMHGIRQ